MYLYIYIIVFFFRFINPKIYETVNVVKANIMNISLGRGVVNTRNLPTFFSSVQKCFYSCFKDIDSLSCLMKGL